jgi:two-component system phosphate regulon sensor histidine kinase PhoR
VRLGIRSRLVLVSVGITAVGVFAADYYLVESLHRDLTERAERDLFVRAALVERAVSSADIAGTDPGPWDDLADDLATLAGGRVTVIAPDGAVLGDSDVSGDALALVENHADRPEVRGARDAGRGSSTRLSSTVGERMMYVAVPFSARDGWRGVARVSVPLREIDEPVARLRNFLFVGSALALGLAAAVAALAARTMSRTIRGFTDVARRLAEGDLAARTPPAADADVAELGRALDGLSSSLTTALGDLRSERDLLGRVLDGMREGVLLVDKEGRVALTNPALREMLLLGANVSGKLPLELVRSTELKRLLDRVERSGKAEAAEVDVGELKPRRLLIHATPLAEIGGTLAVFVDVTDLRRLESMRKDFVANVSHELRTPVATVLSAAETLQNAGLAGGEAGEFVEIIQRNAERLHRLVEDLLDLSRIESREFKLSLEPVDLLPVVEHTLALFRDRIEAKRLAVSTSIDPEAPVRADRRALEQILTNLIDNAIKYTSERSAVAIRSERRGDKVRVVVIDTGPGIEAKHLPRLFERFYRADAGRSRELGGTGLGLSIVKNLAEAMGGTVAVESTPGTGATFTVMLPTAPSPSADQLAAKSTQAPVIQSSDASRKAPM